jgi:nitrite reductase/ring-hydroxylating ferredoxin subunit
VQIKQSSPFARGPTDVLDLGLAEEILVGGRAVVRLRSGVSVLIISTRRGVFAVQNRCPHRSLPLTSAPVRRGNLRCPFHGREYDLTSGACRGGPRPRTDPLTTYRVWIEQDRLFLVVPADT